MATKLIIPPLGESISEATLVKWFKKVGESVLADEPIADLETDKITVALPAPHSGVLTEQTYKVGSVVKIGDSIGTLSAQSAKGDSNAGNNKTETSISPPSANQAPQVQQTPTASITKPVATPVSSKPMVEAISPKEDKTQETKPTLPGPALPPSLRQAQREAKQNGTYSESQEITKASSSQSLSTNTSPAPLSAKMVNSGTTLAPLIGNKEEVVPMSPLRKRIAERLVAAQQTAAILTTFNEADMSKIIELRTQHQEAFTKKHGIKLGFMSFFVKACAAALKSFPGLNAEIRGSDIIYKKHYDFGIAVGSGKGLVVPIIRDVDQLSLAGIEKAIIELSQKAKENKLTLNDLSGGTFSITNGGIYGSMMSTPLLNLPQTGILGMHNIIRRPIAVGDQVVIRPMMYLALSYDHRVVDGREAVQCLVQIKDLLEQPEKLLLEI